MSKTNQHLNMLSKSFRLTGVYFGHDDDDDAGVAVDGTES